MGEDSYSNLNYRVAAVYNEELLMYQAMYNYAGRGKGVTSAFVDSTLNPAEYKGEPAGQAYFYAALNGPSIGVMPFAADSCNHLVAAYTEYENFWGSPQSYSNVNQWRAAPLGLSNPGAFQVAGTVFTTTVPGLAAPAATPPPASPPSSPEGAWPTVVVGRCCAGRLPCCRAQRWRAAAKACAFM